MCKYFALNKDSQESAHVCLYIGSGFLGFPHVVSEDLVRHAFLKIRALKVGIKWYSYIHICIHHRVETTGDPIKNRSLGLKYTIVGICRIPVVTKVQFFTTRPAQTPLDFH